MEISSQQMFMILTGYDFVDWKLHKGLLAFLPFEGEVRPNTVGSNVSHDPSHTVTETIPP